MWCVCLFGLVLRATQNLRPFSVNYLIRDGVVPPTRVKTVAKRIKIALFLLAVTSSK